MRKPSMHTIEKLKFKIYYEVFTSFMLQGTTIQKYILPNLKLKGFPTQKSQMEKVLSINL